MVSMKQIFQIFIWRKSKGKSFKMDPEAFLDLANQVQWKPISIEGER